MRVVCVHLSKKKILFEQSLDALPAWWATPVRNAVLLYGKIVRAVRGSAKRDPRRIDDMALWLKENELPNKKIVGLLLSSDIQEKLLDTQAVSFGHFYGIEIIARLKNQAYQQAWAFVDRCNKDVDNVPRVMIHNIAGIIFYNMALTHVLQDTAVNILLIGTTFGLEQIHDAHIDAYAAFDAVFSNKDQPDRQPFFSKMCRLLQKRSLEIFLLALERLGMPVWEKIPVLERMYGYDIPLARQTLKQNTSAVYVVIMDGPPAINSRSGLALCAALRRRGVPCVVITNRRRTVRDAEKLGVEAIQCGMTPTGIRGIRQYRRSRQSVQAGQALLHSAGNDAGRYWKAALSKSLMDLHATASVIRQDFRSFFAVRPPLLLLSLGESHILSMIAKEQAGAAVPWLGWNHILTVGTREDAFFPADHHLFYGQHGADIFIGASGNVADAAVVGTPTYDSAFHRDKAADAAYTASLIPKWKNGLHLVVVGTENRIQQNAEVESSLRVLLAMPSIHIVLKLHPEELPEQYQRMADRLDPFGERITVIHKCDLDALLHAADLLITMFSNIIVNASVLETPSIVYDLHGSRPIDFHAEGLSLLAETPESLHEQVGRILESSEFRKECVDRAAKNLSRFVGPGDAKSVEHVADIIERQLEHLHADNVRAR